MQRKANADVETTPVFDADNGYSLEGLQKDFQTSKELAKFVYDETGIALAIQGRKPDIVYQVALAALQGQEIDPKFITSKNPYVDKEDEIPVEALPQLPPRDAGLPPVESIFHRFYATNMPHPSDPHGTRRVNTWFRKYQDGTITFEIEGPLELQGVGEKKDKFGNNRPAEYRWLDPRTGEKLLKSPNGSFTTAGQNLYAFFTASDSKYPGVWGMIDRDMASVNIEKIYNPW